MEKDMKLLGIAPFWDELSVGDRFRTVGRTLTETDLEVKGPTFVGDTIHVECTVSEVRETSKGHRGLVRTENQVVNQKGGTVLRYNPLRMVKGSKGQKGHR